MELLLLFRLDEELYGLEVANLQEIVEAPPLFPIPLAPPCFSGAMNFHGQILPVLDLPAYLGCTGSARDRRVVVLASHLCPLAFSATAVQRIVPFAREALAPVAEHAFVRSRLEREGENVALLDAAALVASFDTLDFRGGNG